METMETLLASCTSAIANNSNVFISILIAGFLGSLTHCITMCGPLVAAQAIMLKSEKPAQHPTLLHYHLGRLTTYVLLGILVATSSAWLFGSTLFPYISSTLLLLAGGLFIASALKPRAMHSCQCENSFLQKGLDSLNFSINTQLYLRGFLLGFMPCGLVIAALLLVATTQNFVIGGLAMLLFGLTTLPTLQAISYSAFKLTNRWEPTMAIVGKGAMTLNGVLLCALGMKAF